jgi:hypothetical protein
MDGSLSASSYTGAQSSCLSALPGCWCFMDLFTTALFGLQGDRSLVPASTLEGLAQSQSQDLCSPSCVYTTEALRLV